ncbi:MAG: hypothetical protein ACT6FG_05690 [Methanosarcinaceae archaeon]
MANILKPKVQASGLMDVALMGISKSVGERALAPIIGNGTLSSGAMKLVAGGLVQGSGKMGNIVGSGFVIDGVEDIVNSFMGGMGGSQAAASEDW